MKVYAFNGSPRKNRNTAQRRKAFVNDVLSAAPDYNAGIHLVRQIQEVQA